MEIKDFPYARTNTNVELNLEVDVEFHLVV